LKIVKNLGAKRLSRGQGMTEYIIIVALIAVAAIGVYSFFGKTVRNQTAAMAAALGGDNEKAVKATEDAGKAGKGAQGIANKNGGLDSYTTEAKGQ